MKKPVAQKHQLIMGAHAVKELLCFAPEKIIKVYSAQEKDHEILELCRAKNIPLERTKGDVLRKMVDSDSHQLFVAHIKERTFLSPKDFLEKEEKSPSLVLMLDQIFDPQNFGALIRSAECLGASAVIWSKNRGADLTPVVAKTSCGASEILPLIRVSNLATALEPFQKAGYEVVGAALEEGAESADGFVYQEKTVLIVGSEGEGIQPLLKKRADRLIYIPMKGKIASLNVAQAASALLALWGARPR